jgi:hypothetical protein
VIKINEFQASNFATLPDNDFSAFSDWIELYNPGNQDVNLGGYFLTDDLQDIQKWQIPANTVIPAGGFLLFWCDDRDVVLNDYHLNFKLDGGGEAIGLFNQSLQVVDTITFGDQVEDVSFGRKPDGSTTWKFFADPTPLAPNTTQGYATIEQPADPDFSIGSGFYPSTQFLILTSPSEDAEIRYTTDGSEPGLSDMPYTGPITINQTVLIRARCFQEGLLPGDIESRSYFVNESTSLPVFSLTMNPEFLWDPAIGIYVDEDIQNRTEWERAGKMEYFNEDHEKDFVIQASLRLFGNTAYFYPQKSLAVFPENDLEYPLFESQETDVFTSFLLRSSSDDWPYTMLRDALMHTLIKGRLTIDHQAYSPSVFFINGEYFGIHNIREKINEDFLASYHNVDPNDLDIIYIDMRDTTIIAIEGNLDEIYNTIDLVTNHDLSIDENYAEVANVIDIDNYIDFLIANLFYSNTSWHHNVKIWKEQNDQSKWQWLLYDLDRGMTDYYVYAHSVIEDLDTTDLFFPHLNENESFRNKLINRLSGHMNSTFQAERVNGVIDSLANRIEDEIPGHSLRWKDECDNQGNCGIQSLDDWYDDIDELRGYTEYAQPLIRQYLTEFYDLQGTAQLSIEVEGPGTVYIEGVEFSSEGSPWTYFKGIPINLLAVPDNGHVFLAWEGLSFDPELQITLSGDQTIKVRFGDYCFIPTLIEENMTLSSDCDAYFSQGPVTIQSGAVLTIEAGVQIFMTPGDSIHVFGSLNVQGSSGSEVVFQSIEENQPWGCIHAEYGSISLNHTHFFDNRAVVSINGGSIEVLNSYVHYSPFFYGDIFSIHLADTHIENCIIEGPDDDGKTDAIDCDEITYGLLKNNTIFGTTDDGIDIGTESVNVIVTGNRIYNCGSMGISVGEYSEVLIEKNIVVGCLSGIQVHSEAVARIDHNTLFNNEVSIRCYHYSNQSNSGGHAIVTNCILSQSQLAVFELFENSTISIDYSLSDTEPVQGQENLFTDPQFMDAENLDFSLQENSPCIDSGDPGYPNDPDGTRTDMGAVFFDHTASVLERNIGRDLFLYPNPAVGSFTCYLTDTSKTIQKMEVYDLQGRIVYRQDGLNESFVRMENNFELQGLFYLQVVTSKGQSYRTKFIWAGR